MPRNCLKFINNKFYTAYIPEIKSAQLEVAPRSHN